MKDLTNESYNYSLMDLDEKSLRKELSSWKREELIVWLKWNDLNGIYRDEEGLAEVGSIMSYEQGVEIMVSQIIQ